MLSTRRRLLMASVGASLRAAGEDLEARSFWVLGLLQPRELRLTADRGTRLHCTSPKLDFILEPGESRLLSAETNMFCACGPGNRAAAFTLEVPRVLQRRFYGSLTVKSAGGILSASITMPVEVAVSAIVGAELPILRAPMQSLLTQAVLARSFMLGTRSPRHPAAFFCDTTHCQFLRSPALPESSVARATLETTRFVLTNNGKLFPASYSAACGGRTEGGERDGFFYPPVACPTCQKFGLPRRGHGWGLCQEGAMEMARRGATMHNILAHYFPQASLRYL